MAYVCMKHSFKIKNTYLTLVISILILSLTCVSPGIEDIHRWISIGSIRLNVAFICLPILLISINNLINIDKKHICYILIIVIVTILGIFIVISWINLDNLAPVSYVEDIVILAQESGFIYLLFSLASFFVMIMPFGINVIHQSNSVISMSFALFFMTLILCGLFADFPVPLMGYGISPIIGYKKHESC